MEKIKTIEEFLAKIEKVREESGVDLSTAEDLSVAVMNLISLEEHFFFTAMKTGADGYFDTAAEIREMRKKLLAELMPNHEGETWCASKHLLAAAMRLVEVGNKLQSGNKKEEAKKMFEDAYKIYGIFWALKLKLLTAKKMQQTSARASSFDDLVGKLADCCKE